MENNYFVILDNQKLIVITSRALEQFSVLVGHGHFGKAAAALQISQPALTKSIRRLEAELGVELIDRQAGRAEPTPYGEILLRRGRAILLAERDLREEIASVSGSRSGLVNVALGPYPSMLSGYLALSDLISKHPGITAQLHVTSWRDVARRVADRSVDLGIAELSGLQGSKELTTEPIAQHRGFFCCRKDHPLVGTGQVPLARMFAFPWIASRMPPRVATQFPKDPGRAGSIDLATGDFVPSIEVDVPMQLGVLLKQTDALAPCTLTMVRAELMDGSISILPVEDLAPATAYGFIVLRERTLPLSVLSYMETVRSVEKSLALEEIEIAKALRIQIPATRKRKAPNH